jgi:hypothetical protein
MVSVVLAIYEQIARDIQKLLIHISKALCFQMQTHSRDGQDLALAVGMSARTVEIAQYFRDILMMKAKVIPESSSTQMSVQRGLCFNRCGS